MRFDEEPDHGLANPDTRAAWRELLLGVLPPAPARIADLGCGTGTLTRLLTDEGNAVDGIDFSPEMIRKAWAKVPEAKFVVGDAVEPALAPRGYEGDRSEFRPATPPLCGDRTASDRQVAPRS